MNTYFEQNKAFDSNTRIYEGCFTDALVGTSRRKKHVDVWLSVLVFLSRILMGSTVRRIVKTVLVALSLVGFVGIVGAVELGSLSMGSAALIGAALLGIEFLCLRGCRANKE